MSGYNKKYDVSTCNSQCVGIGLRSETIMNIYDIAKLSGVSIATVSRVINNSPKVSEKTKKKVWDVMNEYDYTPNVFARGLGLNSVKTVGLPRCIRSLYGKCDCVFREEFTQVWI